MTQVLYTRIDSIDRSPIDCSHLQMHPLPRLRRDRTGNLNFCIWILQLHHKLTHHAGHGTSQLGPRKIFTDARPLAMQKRNLREIRWRAAIMVYRLHALFVRVDPALRQEFFARGTPEVWAAVCCVRAQGNASTTGNGCAGDDGVADGFADCGGDGWIQTQNFLADAVE